MIKHKHCWILLNALFVSMVYIPFAQTALLVSEREIEIKSEKAWEQMLAQNPRSRDLTKRALVRCVAKNIIKQLDEPYRSSSWEIELFENPGVNAFAMPGGKLGVFSGLFEVAADQDELATVIGHEIAHVTKKHSYERAKRDMRTQIGATIGMAVLMGNMASKQITSQAELNQINNQINTINMMSQIMAEYGLNLPFNRSQEKDADKAGLLYMARAGFNPLKSLSLWKKMQDQGNRPNLEFVSSHPSDKKRINGLSSQLSKTLSAYNAVARKPSCGYRR